jgi:hypothetical protein
LQESFNFLDKNFKTEQLLLSTSERVEITGKEKFIDNGAMKITRNIKITFFKKKFT